jgi:putative sterol carrier protein
MSDVVAAAVAALAGKVAGFDGSARFVIEGEGAIIVDGAGVRASTGSDDEAADVTLTADADTFRAILDGDLNPTSAFMQGRLRLDGDMGTAMRLGSALA